MNKLLQKKNFAALSACVLIIAILVCIGINAKNNKFKLILNKISSEEILKVDFENNIPVSIDNTVLVPLRTICSSAGLTLDWDEQSKSACVTLNAQNPSTPAEIFCDQFLTSEKSAVADVQNKSISVVIPVDSCDVKLYYNYTDQNGEDLSFENCYQWNAGARIMNDGTLMVPVRNIMECFGFDVDWSSKNNTVTVSIPDIDELSFDAPAAETFVYESAPQDQSLRTQSPFFETNKITQIPQSPSIAYSPIKNYTIGEYIGRFKVTHYCTCSICNGGYGNSTAYGGAIRPGITIAVDPRVIKKLSWVYIDGYGARLAEDVGGAIKGNRIDMAVSDHATAMSMGVTYCDVWYAGVPNGSENINMAPAQGGSGDEAAADSTEAPSASFEPSSSPEVSDELTPTNAPSSEVTIKPSANPSSAPKSTEAAKASDAEEKVQDN